MVWAIREVPLICLDSCNIQVVHLQPYYMCSSILVECFVHRNMFLQLQQCHCYEFKRHSSSFPLSVPGYTCILYVQLKFRIKCLYLWVTRSHLKNGNHKAEQAVNPTGSIHSQTEMSPIKWGCFVVSSHQWPNVNAILLSCKIVMTRNMSVSVGTKTPFKIWGYKGNLTYQPTHVIWPCTD